MNKIIIFLLLSGIAYGGRVAHYKMNDNSESTSTVVDSIGTSNGTYKDASGAIYTNTGSTAGKISTCLDFDGDEYVDTGATFQSTFRGDFSISLWCKPDDGRPASIENICGSNSIDNGDSVYISLCADGTFLFFYKANANFATLDTSTVLNDGQEDWHHIAAVASSTIAGVGGLKFYLDGSLETPITFTGDTSSVVFGDFASTVNIYISSENNAGSPYRTFSGLIDDVRIYSECLTQTNVDFLYNSGNGTEADYPYYFLANAE
jgi:hypothetical protein